MHELINHGTHKKKEQILSTIEIRTQTRHPRFFPSHCSKYMPKRALEHILTSDFLASSFTLFNRAKELFSYMLIFPWRYPYYPSDSKFVSHKHLFLACLGSPLRRALSSQRKIWRGVNHVHEDIETCTIAERNLIAVQSIEVHWRPNNTLFCCLLAALWQKPAEWVTSRNP